MLAASVGAVAPRLTRADDSNVSQRVSSGWREAVLIVADARSWIATLLTVGGWELIWRGRSDDSLNALWKLTPAARTQQWLLRNRGTQSGYIRLVTIHGVEQQRIRAHDQAWETGGIAALDVRVLDIEQTRRELEARGWNAPSDPVRYKTYGVEVIQWAPRSPDGVRLSFIQRISPPLQGWDELKKWSRLTNAAILVHDMPAAKHFYAELLGLHAYSESNTVGSGGANVMGLPWPLNTQMATDIHGYNGNRSGNAAIELIAMPEARGRDHAATARPPNLGTAALRFIVEDIDALTARLAAGGFAPQSCAPELSLSPFGAYRACAIVGPDGEWLEFLQRR